MPASATAAANRLCRSNLLTASIDSLTFRHPTRVGDIVTIRGIVSAAFDHSIEVYVTVEREDASGASLITNDGWLTAVAIDAQGELLPVPPVVPLSDDEVSRHRGAADRRARRLAGRDAARAHAHAHPQAAATDPSPGVVESN
nr:hypothetical protein HK105_001963 [Polyrhizophydium stewartii]